ncbi:MAG: hypothetical protein QOE55_3224 [Acidobacteriaceae bacterium]|nr:hypothetical protein [Acidobacteriaceae bacterium]
MGTASTSHRIAVVLQSTHSPDRGANNGHSDEGIKSADVVANAEGLSGPLRRQRVLGCKFWVAANRNPSTIDSVGAGPSSYSAAPADRQTEQFPGVSRRAGIWVDLPRKNTVPTAARMSNARAAETDLPIGLMEIGLCLLSFVSSNDISNHDVIAKSYITASGKAT